jgi:hypothetical protein
LQICARATTSRLCTGLREAWGPKLVIADLHVRETSRLCTGLRGPTKSSAQARRMYNYTRLCTGLRGPTKSSAQARRICHCKCAIFWVWDPDLIVAKLARAAGPRSWPTLAHAAGSRSWPALALGAQIELWGGSGSYILCRNSYKMAFLIARRCEIAL